MAHPWISFRVDLSHQLDFLFRELRKVANEEHQFPVLVILAAPSRHSREPDAVLDDVEQLAIREFLGIWFAHVRRRWIQPGIYLCLATAVVGMAYRAVIGEMVARFGNREGRSGNGIF